MGRESISSTPGSEKALADFEVALTQAQARAVVASMSTNVAVHEGRHSGEATTGNDVGKSGSREL